MPKASKVARHYHKVGTLSLYYGLPPASQLISDFLNSVWATPEDDRARELLLLMTIGQIDREQAYRELTALGNKKSRLATYLVAVHNLGAKDEELRAAGTRLLEALADKGFLPAMHQLCAEWTTRDLASQLPGGTQRVQTLFSYARKGSITCVVLLGQAYLEGRIRLKDNQVDELCLQLVEGVRSRSWECLRLLVDIYRTCLPMELSPDIPEPILETLRLAALAGMTDAMLLLGELYHSGRILPRNIDYALFWYRRAWEHGSMDAGCAYARTQLDYAETDSELDDARHILEYGCSQMHAASHLGLGEYFLKAMPEEADPKLHTFETLIRTAAQLGDADTYAHFLFEQLRTGEAEDIDAYEAPFLRNSPIAMYWYARSLNTLSLRERPGSRPDKQAFKMLRDLAHDCCVPACNSLAEYTYFGGLYGFRADAVAADHWIDLGRQCHSLRCWTLYCLKELRLAQGLGMQHRIPGDIMHLLYTLGSYDDLLAQAIVTCQLCMVTSPDADRSYKIGTTKDQGEQAMTMPAGMLSDNISRAGRDGDLAVFAYLEKEFANASGCRVVHTLARLIARNLNFGDWLNCHQLSQICGVLKVGFMDPVLYHPRNRRGNQNSCSTGDTETGRRARNLGRPQKPQNARRPVKPKSGEARG